MTEQTWTMDASDGELLLHTGVTGTAARMGHRLTIAMRSWQAAVRFDGDDPIEVAMTVDVDSLEVLRGEGGVTPLSGPEKAVVGANALKLLRASRFPQIRFHADEIEHHDDSYRLIGTLEINGRVGDRVLDVQVVGSRDSWQISGESDVRHNDYSIKQYALLMGAMKVADEVHVTFRGVISA